MTMPARQQKTRIHGDRLVRPGDQVRLLPVNLRNYDEEECDYFSQEDYDFHRNWLGDGPFTISWIGRWPCGRIMLYLKGAKTDEPGVYASDFM